MHKYVVVAAMLAAFATPVLAAEYYVGKKTTGGCKIVQTKPDGQSLVMVGTGSYPTKDDADAAKKAAAECKKQNAN